MTLGDPRIPRTNLISKAHVLIRKQAGLKFNIHKTKIMASSPITSWEIDGGKVETVTYFILGAPKSLQTVAEVLKLKDACSLEEKL